MLYHLSHSTSSRPCFFWWGWGVRVPSCLSQASSHFCSDYFGDRVCFFAQAQTAILLFYTVAGMIAEHPHTQLLSFEMGSLRLLCPEWPGTTILWISASQVARITGVSHQRPSWPALFFGPLKKALNLQLFFSTEHFYFCFLFFFPPMLGIEPQLAFVILKHI
jgi:hypothetical protein